MLFWYSLFTSTSYIKANLVTVNEKRLRFIILWETLNGLILSGIRQNTDITVKIWAEFILKCNFPETSNRSLTSSCQRWPSFKWINWRRNDTKVGFITRRPFKILQIFCLLMSPIYTCWDNLRFWEMYWTCILTNIVSDKIKVSHLKFSQFLKYCIITELISWTNETYIFHNWV